MCEVKQREERVEMGKGNPQRRSTGDELHTAARSGDLVAIQMILTSNPLAVNSRDKHSRTLVMLHVSSENDLIVSYLCKNKANVGASAMDDMAAIHFATQKRHLEVVKALVAAGASIKVCTCKGMNSLHYAAQGSHLELVRYLAKKGASLTAKIRARKTPLDLANNEEVRSFLEEFERSAKNRASSNKNKAEQSDPKASTLESEDNSSAKQPAVAVDEENGDGEKRETNEDDENSDREKRKANEEDAREDSSQSKRAKVKLSHLQSSDDIQEEEEEDM
ncbi:uncharacterized protein [Arachis hypogaea]|uniref:Uncharacterized protein n=1 Tax=Arachis hypogaea TaxID=3818 RepID=A0A445EKM8_ARAHY|nr:hypothetical protein Ahy_A01g000485 [Arachis hypogaea]